ncbi:hypothetical protein EVAR_28913_1 [Eumeta japonica]|uniref:Uncharacterized protein n=1 Tax=Eumeta variegata TaxID=151549 RepID=A0A4C1WZJ1_EUMVA|nr:hypothetical protein EVAR_28913_1 [Eumeta japonica]
MGKGDNDPFLCGPLKKNKGDAAKSKGPPYNSRNPATVKLVTKALQWRKIGKQGERRKGRGAVNLRIASPAGNSECYSFMSYTVLIALNIFMLQRERNDNVKRRFDKGLCAKNLKSAI